MRQIFPIKAHDKTLTERSIREILFFFPYLIDSRLKSANLDKKLMVFDDLTRTDFTFSDENNIIIVELKKDVIDERALDQLIGYMNKTLIANGKGRRVSGILLGFSVKDSARLLQKIELSGFDIRLKVYGKDVPTIIKICRKCRRVISASETICGNCGNSEFLRYEST